MLSQQSTNSLPKIITARRAAKIIGCTNQTMAERLKRGIWKFGRAYPPDETHKYWRYEVYTQLLMDYLEGK